MNRSSITLVNGEYTVGQLMRQAQRWRVTGAHVIPESGLGTESLYVNEKQKMRNYSVNDQCV